MTDHSNIRDVHEGALARSVAYVIEQIGRIEFGCQDGAVRLDPLPIPPPRTPAPAKLGSIYPSYSRLHAQQSLIRIAHALARRLVTQREHDEVVDRCRKALLDFDLKDRQQKDTSDEPE